MISFIFKVAIVVFLVVLIYSHGDTVVAFFGGVVDWLAYWMNKVAVGPPR